MTKQKNVEDYLHDIALIRDERRRLADRERDAVARARRARATWREIGEALGMTAQAAQQRYGQS